MPQMRSLGTPNISGQTVEDLRRSMQFWAQQIFDHLDQISGLRGTPRFYSALDAGGNALRNLASSSLAKDAVTQDQTLVLTMNPENALQQFDAGGVGIFNLPAGDHALDAVNLGQLPGTITDILRNSPDVLPFADPTAQVGLTVVPGSATTIMRSDAAPPLSQAIIPTWTGLHTFSVNPVVTNAAPGLTLTDTTAAAKSLTIAVDANLAQLRESAGA